MSRLMECSYTGKKVYWTEEKAFQEAIRLQKHSMNMRVYQCNKCKWWHLATVNKKKREKPDESLPD